MTEQAARARDVRVSRGQLIVELLDGRKLVTPLSWYPRLARAGVTARRGWRLIGDGVGIHWPALDEDLSVAGLLRGVRAPAERSRSRRRRTPRKSGRSSRKLTETERTVLALMADSPGLSLNEIADRVGRPLKSVRLTVRRVSDDLARLAG